MNMNYMDLLRETLPARIQAAIRKVARYKFALEYRYCVGRGFAGQFGRHNEWRKWGTYQTNAIAQKAMAGLSRRYTFYEFRITSMESP